MSVKRFWAIFVGKANGVLDDIDRPEYQIEQFSREMTSQVDGLQRAVAAALADEKKLRREVDELNSKAAEWETNAVLALKEEREDLAREALLKKDDCASKAAVLQKAWEQQKASTVKLKKSLVTARERIDEAKRQHTLLLARYQSASAQKKISQSLDDKSSGSTLDFVDKLNDKILRMEAEAEALSELAADGSGSDLETTFTELKRRKRGEDALTELKARLGTKRPGESHTS